MATNTLTTYDPIFYANEALIVLKKALGRAVRVHRGYDKQPQQKGSTIQISRPSTFQAQDAPSSDQSINTSMVSIGLDNWKEVKFSLTDQELNYTSEKIINDHISPAVYALADDIDITLAKLVSDIPWYYDMAATTEIKDLTRTKKVLRENNVPFNDNLLHACVGPDAEAGLLELFTNAQLTGTTSVDPLMNGTIGSRFGLELFANSNVATHTKGTCSVTALVVNGAAARGATAMSLDAAAVTGTLLHGDTFSIAGQSQRYAVTGTSTAAGNAFGNVTFTPALAADVADGAAVTVRLDTHVQNVAFHRNAFAVAYAPLSEMGNNLGAKVATVTDPKSGLILRSRVFYVGDASVVKVALDVLYGVKTLDPNLACVMCG